MSKELKDMTIVELKALSWDHLALIENSQKAIQIINQEIVNKQKALSEIKPSEETNA